MLGYARDSGFDDDLILFNGLDPTSGDYLCPPLRAEELRKRVRKLPKKEIIGGDDHTALLSYRNAKITRPEYKLAADTDPGKLAETGWGILFPSTADPRSVAMILEAFKELTQLRQEQAGGKFKIFSGERGYQPGETALNWAARLGAQPGVVDTYKIPYYLLILADPELIPFRFQYELDAQFAVGRVYFDTLTEYASYAHSVVLAENGEVRLARNLALFGVANSDDPSTQLSARRLINPLAQYLMGNEKLSQWRLDLYGEKEAFAAGADDPPGWPVAELPAPKPATKENLLRLLGGDRSPAFLFSASHGLGWPDGHPQQLPFQGALVCQDWPGSREHRPIQREHFLGAEDIDQNANLLGTMVICFACFGAGTPDWDDYAIAATKDERRRLAQQPFLSALPRKLLSQPKGGALAVIGHVERAWGCSFQWKDTNSQPETFKDVIFRLLSRQPVGYALETLNDRYAQIAVALGGRLDDLKYDADIDAREISALVIANNDARGYALLGDPAVRSPVGEQNEDQRPEIERMVSHNGRPAQVRSAQAAPALIDAQTTGETMAQAPGPDRADRAASNRGSIDLITTGLLQVLQETVQLLQQANENRHMTEIETAASDGNSEMKLQALSRLEQIAQELDEINALLFPEKK